jgi:hypothetical protein
MNASDHGQNVNGSSAPDRDTLMLLSGVALILFGAGLVLSNSTARRFLGQVGLGDLSGVAMPDIERYFKLRSM